MPLQRCVEHARVNINEAVRLMENSVRQRCAYVVSSHEKCERIKANRTTNEVPVVNEWIWQRKLVKPKPLKIESFFFFFFSNLIRCYTVFVRFFFLTSSLDVVCSYGLLCAYYTVTMRLVIHSLYYFTRLVVTYLIHMSIVFLPFSTRCLWSVISVS